MTLTWKDGITTLLAMTTSVFAYLMYQGFDFRIITSYRGGIIVLLLAGVAMCALGSATPNTGQSPLTILASILGGSAIVISIWGLITGAQLPFLLLAADILVLWVVSTFRHIVNW